MSKRNTLGYASMKLIDMHLRVSVTTRSILALFVVVQAAVLPSGASAESEVWTDREICRAALKTYFFLDAKPSDTSDIGQFFGFISASGNVYTCRLEGARAEFRWLNDSGQTITSKSTTFHVLGNKLTVQTDMKDELFLMK